MKFISFFFFLLPFEVVFSQDLSSLKSKAPFTFNGGLTSSLLLHQGANTGIERKPFSFTLGANLNFTFYGISAPFSASYSNERWSYRQPFNRFALHPSWKKLQLHLGDINMSFSPYSLNGLNFRGAGVELHDFHGWSILAMAGRLQKALTGDTLYHLPSVYTRRGYGMRTDYSFKKGSLGFSLFSASDDVSSLPLTDSLRPQPLSNLVTEFHGRWLVWHQLSLNLELAESFLQGDPMLKLTPGIRAIDELPNGNKNRYNNALRGQLSYAFKNSSLGLGVERVDPSYQTLGAYYITNDFVHYTLNYAGTFLADKIRLAVSSGMEKDNLSGLKASSSRRMVNSGNIQFSPGKNFSLGLQYSGFSSYTNIRNPFDQINSTNPAWNPDTLQFTQVTESWSANTSLLVTEKDNLRQQVSGSLNVQRSGQDTDGAFQPLFISGSGGWNLSVKPAGLSVMVNMNYNQTGLKNEIYRIAGPMLSARKSFWEKKLQVNGSFSYNQGYYSNAKTSAVRMDRIAVTLRLKQQYFDLGILKAIRWNRNSGKTKREWTVTGGWKYNINSQKKIKQE